MQFANQLAELAFLRTYCRWDSTLGRRENKWSEPIDRYFSWLGKNVSFPAEVYAAAKTAMLRQEILPSMRALWGAGEAADRDNVILYNCSFAPVDNLRAFSEILFCLMSGAGVGFSVERQFVDNLPPIASSNGLKKTIVVADSTEGWADALYETIVALYQGFGVDHDVSRVRQHGAVLQTKGGRASGPEPLLKLFALCATIIRRVRNRRRNRRLRPIDAHDICCMIGDIVRVGGFRRAAEISFSDLWDELMRHAKDWSEYQFRKPRSHRRRIRKKWAKNRNNWKAKTFPEIRYMANNSANYEERPDRGTFDVEWKQLRESGSGRERHLLLVSGQEGSAWFLTASV